MDETQNEIVFLVITATLFILLLVLVTVNLLLTARNRRLKHKSEIFTLNAIKEQEITSTRLEVTEQTLNYVSRELHDDISQSLTFSIIQLELLSPESEQMNNTVGELKTTLNDALQSARNLARVLSTDYLEQFGLKDSLVQLFERIERKQLIHTVMNYDENVHFKKQEHELFVFRIIQECINNTLKHAEATEIHLSVIMDNADISIIYTDNGKGMDTTHALQFSNSLGFVSMLKRTELMNGKLHIDSEKNKGFNLSIKIPIK